MQRLLAHREGPIPSLLAARSDIPPELDVLFKRMVAKRPEDRPQSMTDVITTLEAILHATASSSKQSSFSLPVLIAPSGEQGTISNRGRPARMAASTDKMGPHDQQTSSRSAANRPPSSRVTNEAAHEPTIIAAPSIPSEPAECGNRRLLMADRNPKPVAWQQKSWDWDERRSASQCQQSRS